MIVIFNRILLVAFMAVLLVHTAMAQSFPGISNSTYAGIYGVIANPASAAGYRYKWDVNIFGADVKAGNTYLSVPKSVLFSMPDSFKRNRDYFLDTTSRRNHNGWGSADIVMPSVLYAIDEKQAVSFVWRVRGSANGGRLPTPLANFFGVNFPNPQYRGKGLTIQQLDGTMHIWNEFGLSYARVIKEGYTSRWKGGITVKLLSGIAAGYADVNNASFVVNTSRNADITSGTLHYAYNGDVDTWEKPYTRNVPLFKNIGVGFDIGVIYEYRADNGGWGKAESSDADDYTFRIGVSLNDIGRIKYSKGKYSTDLDLRKEDVNPREIGYKNKENINQYAQRLSRYFTPIGSDSMFTMTLPATLNLMGDYNIDSRFFISANAVIALNGGRSNITKTYALTQFLLTPRYETERFGAYLPVVVNYNGQADIGAGFRVGPLVIGSYSIFTNLFRKHVDHADAFVALRLNSGMIGRGKARNRQLGCPVNE
ncbi:DUF5723 family protein [Chitinophaga solisilvae]|uniref:DUF5723 family protein n=1 Tax=Chitinophaga solisilvae TaxID=1233460 RepID=UPI001F2A6A3A|nr:DUF5723 family protein [Chitinophaga solisilvae]